MKLPIGIQSFKQIREEEYIYVVDPEKPISKNFNLCYLHPCSINNKE